MNRITSIGGFNQGQSTNRVLLQSSQVSRFYSPVIQSVNMHQDVFKTRFGQAHQSNVMAGALISNFNAPLDPEDPSQTQAGKDIENLLEQAETLEFQTPPDNYTHLVATIMEKVFSNDQIPLWLRARAGESLFKMSAHTDKTSEIRAAIESDICENLELIR